MSIILLRHLNNNKRFGLAVKFITFNIRYFCLLWSYFNFHIGGHDLEIPRNLVRRFIIGNIHHKLQSYVGIIGTKLYKFWKFVRGKYKQIFFSICRNSRSIYVDGHLKSTWQAVLENIDLYFAWQASICRYRPWFVWHLATWILYLRGRCNTW